MPKKYFDLYDPKTVSLAPNRFVPTGFKEENFHADGTFELVGLNGTVSVEIGSRHMKLETERDLLVCNVQVSYNLNAGPVFLKDHQDFNTPLDEDFSRAQRRGYFAAVSFTDANVGRVVDALEKEGYKDNTIVLLWGGEAQFR